MSSFQLDAAKNYWKYVPTGLGKIDSSQLILMDDETLKNTIADHLIARNTYYFEDVHFVKYFCELFKGKKVLSFGSGLGHDELQFANAGADVTCADIIPTNLKVIQRIAGLAGLDGVKTVVLSGDCDDDLHGEYDYIFCRGSLHHMPFPLQKKTFENFARNLKEDGAIILMLYTKQFEDDFSHGTDEAAFGAVSDPDVDGVSNPWSEWYDDAKLMELSDGKFCIAKKQLWNEDWYQWVELKRGGCSDVQPFIDLEKAEGENAELVETVSFSEAKAHGNASLQTTNDGLSVDMGSSDSKISLFGGNGFSGLFNKKGAMVNKIRFTSDIKHGYSVLNVNCLMGNHYSKHIVSKGKQTRAIYFTEEIDVSNIKLAVHSYRETSITLNDISFERVDYDKIVPYALKLHGTTPPSKSLYEKFVCWLRYLRS